MSKNDVTMAVRRRSRPAGQLSTGPGAARGRTRTVDIDENDTYFPAVAQDLRSHAASAATCRCRIGYEPA